uniref:Uncharacterized protein n=1 Tax=Vitis vinifera TaxID=29760 RepID=F6HWP5_VITVI
MVAVKGRRKKHYS